MGAEHNYELVFRGEPHWRNAYNELKSKPNILSLASGIDKGLSSDCRKGKFSGLSIVCDALSAVGKSSQGKLLIMEIDIILSLDVLEDACQKSCLLYPENEKTISNFKRISARRIENSSPIWDSLASPLFVNSVLTEFLKVYALSYLESAVEIGSRNQRVAPCTVEAYISEAISKIDFSKFVSKIKDGAETGPNSVRACIYQRGKANASLLGRE